MPRPDALVTKTGDGGLAIAVWNLVDPPPTGQKQSPVDAHAGTAGKRVQLVFQGVAPTARVSVQRVDDEHGNVLPIYAAMGKPQYPTPAQAEEMNRRTALPAPEEMKLQAGQLELTLEPNALVLIRVSAR